jgi:hypothetical protein
LTAVMSGRPRAVARRGRGHHGEKTLCQGIERHIGSGAQVRLERISLEIRVNSSIIVAVPRGRGLDGNNGPDDNTSRFLADLDLL